MSVSRVIALFAAFLLLLFTDASQAATAAISGGLYHTIALKTEGTVWSWGDNNAGQLGDGTNTSRQTPVEVAHLFGVTAIAAGSNHNLALKSDGTVWAWGDNTYGQLGDGTTTSRNVPVQVGGLSGVVAIVCGANHSFALKSDGSWWAWGNNAYGQLGDATKANRLTPVSIRISGVSMVAAGDNHTIALKTDGTLWSWGRNQVGQLGDGTTTDKLYPVQIDPYSSIGINKSITAVFARGDSSYAVKNDGTVWAWGNNNDSQLGLGLANATKTISTPAEIAGFTGVESVSAGYSHAVAMKTDGSIWSWGSNAYGQLGSGSPGSPNWVYAPQQISGLSGVVRVVAGGYHTVVLKTDNTVMTFGYNGYGQLGIGSLTQTATPTLVSGYNGSGFLDLTTSATPQTGWWWNPAESGRGFAIEERGGNVFFGGYLYDTTGRATWYVSTGATTGTSVYQGNLLGFGNGQTLTGAYKANTSLPSPGTVTLLFSDASHGLLTWPGGTIPIQRFNIVTNGLAAPPAAFQPEAGWWWNPAESGRGFALEIQNGTLFMAGYMYDANGNPIWYTTENAMTSQSAYQGNWVQYANGQTLTGAYKAPTVLNSNVGSVSIVFTTTTAATLTLPDGRQISLVRFAF